MVRKQTQTYVTNIGTCRVHYFLWKYLMEELYYCFVSFLFQNYKASRSWLPISLQAYGPVSPTSLCTASAVCGFSSYLSSDLCIVLWNNFISNNILN